MNDFDYKGFYNKVGHENGWNFSDLKVTVEGEAPDFYGEVRRRCSGSDVLLDIGTGGGEQILSLADHVGSLVGIDNSFGMTETANRNLAGSGKTNVRFLQMESDQLEFPAGSFHIATSRHAPFNAAEIAKVLKPGGLFMTQQVSEHDKRNIKEWFGRGQCYGEEDGASKRTYISELTDAGFTGIEFREYDMTETYETVEDLLFLLKYTPILPGFGETDDDFTLLEGFVKANTTEKGIRTNSKRYRIAASIRK